MTFTKNTLTRLILTLITLTSSTKPQTTTTTNSGCTAQKFAFCETDGTNKWCTKCFNSRLVRTSQTSMKCEGTSTSQAGCMVTGLIDASVKCIECSKGFVLDTNYNCINATKTNCFGGTKPGTTDSCSICQNGFQPAYQADGTFTCNSGNQIANCAAVSSMWVGTTLTPYCMRCNVKYYENNNQCTNATSSTMNERCQGGTILTNKGCSQCAVWGGFFAIDIYKGEQVCQLSKSMARIVLVGSFLVSAFAILQGF